MASWRQRLGLFAAISLCCMPGSRNSINVCVMNKWVNEDFYCCYVSCLYSRFYCGLELMEVIYTRAQNRKPLKRDLLTSLFSKLLRNPPQGISHKTFSSDHVCDFLGTSFPFPFRLHLVPGARLLLLPILINQDYFCTLKSPVVVSPTVGAWNLLNRDPWSMAQDMTLDQAWPFFFNLLTCLLVKQ